MHSKLLHTVAALPQKKRRRAKAVFALFRKEIVEAQRQHWPLNAIWEGLQADGRFPYSYSTFSRLAHQLLAKPGEPRASEKASGFTYNPVANKDELF